MAYTAVLNGKTVVLKTPLPNTNHAAVAANDLEVRVKDVEVRDTRLCLFGCVAAAASSANSRYIF